ncbi:hypothetical protein [Actinocrispum wychmicini]|uniref:Uncharacterized protein n=1 Tax=Actinocrispum wychmicini TaxID=1213861 RepID=A0A4R2K0W5_9PSEU|nr:hypothetical protein [Actinocrispum wychmicini]TCO65924.1 hypothetical protein EV192_1011716 [Actinocrispum wychmicini]
MTEQPDFPTHGSNRALGLARIEYAEMLFQEAPEPCGAPQPTSELTAQVQASVFLAMYYEMRHGHDLIAAHAQALEEHRAAMLQLTRAYEADQLMPALQNELPPAREPVD